MSAAGHRRGRLADVVAQARAMAPPGACVHIYLRPGQRVGYAPPSDEVYCDSPAAPSAAVVFHMDAAVGLFGSMLCTSCAESGPTTERGEA